MSWSALPVELTFRILSFFDTTELVNFRKINSFFKSLIDETTTLQYRIALFASGMVDGPPGDLTASERLELLRSYSASWKNIEWNEHTTIPSPVGHLWELYGNVWAHSRGSDAIEFVQLPSRLRGIPMRQWTLRFDFALRDFGMDPSQDLLVTIENFRNCTLYPQAKGIHWPERPKSYSTAAHTPFVSVGTTLGSCSWNFLGAGMSWSYGVGEQGVRKLLALSAHMRSFAFLGDEFILGPTLAPPALLVYSLEQRPADSTTHASTPLLRFLFGTHFRHISDILLTSDPSPERLPSAGLQVPFQIAGDERIIAMNLQFVDDREVLRCETFLIPAKALLGQIESLPIKDRHDVDWGSYAQLIEHVPGHGGWDVWTCFVFGMRYILPRVVHLRGKPMIIIRDLSPRRCLRASEEERMESNALCHAITRGPCESYPRSILKCIPLPESIRDPQHVSLMISEDGIVVLDERNLVTGRALVHLLTF
ncbi:hypothetical protein BJY52DRAFT_1415680 [Lactarius psammicola]|nr:hypothetical protein BJY52DRAFT_1415680 [Lactarius psammicola]